jgi:hypothetical protein
LPVIKEEFQRGGGAVAQDTDGATEGWCPEPLAAAGGEPIDAFAAIDRRRGHKEAAVRGALHHQRVSKNVRPKAAMGG